MQPNTHRTATARASLPSEKAAPKVDLAAIAAKEMWTHRDMEALGYATDRATTRRRIARGDFPPPVILSSNSVAWIAAEVRDNAANRPRGLAPQPPRQRPSTAPVTLSAVGRSRGVA